MSHPVSTDFLDREIYIYERVVKMSTLSSSDITNKVYQILKYTLPKKIKFGKCDQGKSAVASDFNHIY